MSSPFPFLSLERRLMSASFICALKELISHLDLWMTVGSLPGSHSGCKAVSWPLLCSNPAVALLSAWAAGPALLSAAWIFRSSGRMAWLLTAGAEPGSALPKDEWSLGCWLSLELSGSRISVQLCHGPTWLGGRVEPGPASLQVPVQRLEARELFPGLICL